jgi:hypothetical protein
MFKSRKSLNISERDPTFKVRYLGNVVTAFVKGDGCVDRPSQILWNNYVTNGGPSSPSSGSSGPGLEMELTICNSGLKVVTKEQGLTEYRAHRITYSVCPPQHPKLFVWVYKHEGRKLKSEVRCHAVLCKTEVMAQTISTQLHERLCIALNEFMREKRRRQNARPLTRNNSLPTGDAGCPGGGAVRTKFLNVGQNFRPSIDRSTSAPKLGSITEGDEDDGPGPAERRSVRNGGGHGSLGRGEALWSTLEENDEDDDDAFVLSDVAAQNGHVSRTRSSAGCDDDDDAPIEMWPSGNAASPGGGHGGEGGDGDDDSTESGFSEQELAPPMEAL